MTHCKIEHAWETLKFNRLIRDFLGSPEFTISMKPDNIVKKFIEKSLAPYITQQYGRTLTEGESALDEDEVQFIEQSLQSYINAKKNYMLLAKTSDRDLNKTLAGMYSSFTKVLAVDEGNYLNKILFNTYPKVESTVPAVAGVLTETPDSVIETSKIDKFTNIVNFGGIDSLFKQAHTAKIIMEKKIKHGIVRNFFINQDEKRFNTTAEEIDSAIKEYKSTLYSNVLKHLGLTNKFSTTLYEDGFITQTFNGFIEAVSTHYKSKGITNRDLENMALSKEPASVASIMAYTDFVILANFDDLFTHYTEGMFKIVAAYKNSLSESKDDIKYKLAVKSVMSSNVYSDKEIFSALDEQTPLFKMIVKSMPIYDLKGNPVINKEVNVNQVNSLVAQIFQDLRETDDTIVFDKLNPLESTKKLFEYYINRQMDTGKTMINKKMIPSDTSIILSTYLYFFKDADLSKVLPAKLVKKLKGAGHSFYELSAETHSKKSIVDLDLYTNIVGNFSKTYFNKYLEYKYDPENKGLMINQPNLSYSGSQALLTGNDINWYSNRPFDEEFFSKITENTEIDHEAQKIKFYGLDSRTGSDLPVILDLPSQKITFEGKPISLTDEELVNLNLEEVLKRIELIIPSLKVSSGQELYNAININLSKDQTVEVLLRLAGYSLYLKSLKGKTFGEVKELPFIKSIGIDTIYNSTKEIYDLQNLYINYSNDIDKVAKAIAYMSGETRKAQTRLANGITEAQIGEVNHMYMTKDWVEYNKKTNGANKNFPLANNFFYKNPKNITNPFIRTYITQGDINKQSSDLSPEEMTQVMIMHDFFGAIAQYDTAFIQPTVFTDKNTHSTIPVSMTKKVALIGKGVEQGFSFSNEILGKVSSDRIMEAMYFSNYSYYKNLAARMYEDYSLVLDYLNPARAKHKPTNAHSKLSVINKEMGLYPENVFREAFNHVHGNKVGLVEDMGITRYKDGDKTIIGLSDNLMHFTDIYSDTEDVSKSFKDMMARRREDFISSLRDFNLKVDFLDLKGEPLLLFTTALKKLGLNLKDIQKNWVDTTGYLKIESNGVLNPLYEKFFALDNFISDSYQLATMGTIHSHPVKKYKNKRGTAAYYEEIESAAATAMYKRQLQRTPMKPFLLNLINGVGAEVNTVYMRDIKVPVFNTFGLTDDMATSDGSTFVPMLQMILQNNSLSDNAVGINMKTLGLSIDPHYNNFGLMKHAEFGITNEWMKRSIGSKFELEKLLKKSYGLPFANSKILPTTINGRVSLKNVTFVPDLGMDYNNKRIDLADVAPDGVYYQNENGEVIQVVSISNVAPRNTATQNIVGNDTSTYNIVQMNLTTGIPVETPPIQINTLYDLWNVLGGKRSISLDSEGYLRDRNDNGFISSDASHYILAEYVNRVGFKNTPQNRQLLAAKLGIQESDLSNLLDTDLSQDFVEGTLPSQNTVHQPLKKAFVGKFVFTSAQKAGAVSVQNTHDIFNSDKTFLPGGGLVHHKAAMLSTGVLMDSDHDTEASTLTEMSQIISILSANAETFGEADQAYQMLGRLVKIKLTKMMDALSEFKDNNNKELLYRLVVKHLIRTFDSKEQIGIANLLSDLAKKGLSNTGFAKAAIDESVSQELANIENGTEGSLDILNRKVEFEGAKMPFSTYIYGQFVSLLSSSLNSDVIKRKHPGIGAVIKPSGGIVQVYEVPNYVMRNGIEVREGTKVLSADNYTKAPIDFSEEIDISEVCMFDHILRDGKEIFIDSPIALVEFKKTPGIVSKLYGRPRDLKPAENKFTVPSLKGRTMTMHELPIYVTAYNVFQLLSGEPADLANILTFLQTKLPSITLANLQDKNYIKTHASVIGQYTKNAVQGVVNDLVNNKRVFLNGAYHPVTNIESIPGECFAPFIYRQNFGLPKGLSVQDVTPKLFYDILTKRSTPKTLDSKYFIRNVLGNHKYVFTTSQVALNPDNFIESDEKTAIIDGKVWTVDEYGDKLLQVPPGAILKKYKNANGEMLDAIIVEDSETEFDIVKAFKKSNNPKALPEYSGIFIVSPTLPQILDYANQGLSQEMYSSFKLALDFDSARIPGEAQHSHTGLRIVDFINTEANTVFVNAFSSFLKGEDFDIDKSYMLGSTIKDGLYTGWHSKFDLSSEEKARLSTGLPVADGKFRSFMSPDLSPDVILSQREVDSILSPELTLAKVETLNKLSRIDSFSTLSTNMGENLALEQEIRNYFTEELSNQQLENAVKNKISRTIMNIILHPLNQVHAESPTNMDEPRAAAAKAGSSIKVSNYNPASKALIQHANMVGKDVIGISASAGLKVFYALTYWGNSNQLKGNLDKILLKKAYTINGITYQTGFQANLNFFNHVRSEVTEEYARFRHPEIEDITEAMTLTTHEETYKQWDKFKAYVNKEYEGQPEVIESILASHDLNTDQSLIQGATMAAATDNAKELILSVINAGPETVSIYMMLSTLGIPYSTIADFMTTPEVQWLVKNSRPNVFNSGKKVRNIKSAIKLYEEGPSVYNYVNGSDTFSAERWFKEKFKAFSGDDPQPIKLTSLKNLNKSFDANYKVVLFLEYLQEEVKRLGTVVREVQYDPEQPPEPEEMVSTKVRLQEGLARHIEEMLYVAKSTAEFNKSTMDNFKEIYTDAEEITMLGALAGINQGIKSNSYGQYAMFEKANQFVYNKMTGKEPAEIISNIYQKAFTKEEQEIDPFMEGATSMYQELLKFSFERFLTEPAYQKMMIKAYDGIKSVYNIFDVITTTPHFNEMLRVPIVMEDTKKALSIKARTITKVINELIEENIIPQRDDHDSRIDEKNFNKIVDFINETMILKWLRNLDPSKRVVHNRTNVTYSYDNEFKFHKEVSKPGEEVNLEIDLATLLGRRNFLNMFEEMLDNIQKGRLDNGRTKAEFLDNAFIQGLRADWKVDPVTQEESLFFRLPINMTNINDYNQAEFNSYLIGFNNIGMEKYNGMYIKDILFLYNTLVHKDKTNKESLTKLFQYDTDYSKDSLLYDYIQLSGEIDFSDVSLKNSKESNLPDYDVTDIILKQFAIKVQPYQITGDRNLGKFISASIFDSTTSKFRNKFFVWNGAVYEEYNTFGDPRVLTTKIDAPLGLKITTEINLSMQEQIKSILSTFAKDSKITINCN